MKFYWLVGIGICLLWRAAPPNNEQPRSPAPPTEGAQPRKSGGQACAHLAFLPDLASRPPVVTWRIGLTYNGNGEDVAEGRAPCTGWRTGRAPTLSDVGGLGQAAGGLALATIPGGHLRPPRGSKPPSAPRDESGLEATHCLFLDLAPPPSSAVASRPLLDRRLRWHWPSCCHWRKRGWRHAPASCPPRLGTPPRFQASPSRQSATQGPSGQALPASTQAVVRAAHPPLSWPSHAGRGRRLCRAHAILEAWTGDTQLPRASCHPNSDTTSAPTPPSSSDATLVVLHCATSRQALFPPPPAPLYSTRGPFVCVCRCLYLPGAFRRHCFPRVSRAPPVDPPPHP